MHQFWVFIGRTDAEADTPILWPPHVKSWLIGKDPDAGRDWGQEVKGTTQDEMAGWHHRLDGYEFEWTLGVGDGQGGLTCCNSWGHKESDMAEWLKWTELKWMHTYGVYKNDTDEIICMAAMETQTQRTDLWTRRGEWGGRRGWDYAESNMETYITICKIDSQWEFAVWLSKLKLGLCNNLEGWEREGGKWEGDSRWRRYMYTYGRFMLMFGRNEHNTIKQLSFN